MKHDFPNYLNIKLSIFPSNSLLFFKNHEKIYHRKFKLSR